MNDGDEYHLLNQCWKVVAAKREVKKNLDYPERLRPLLGKIEELEDELLKLRTGHLFSSQENNQ